MTIKLVLSNVNYAEHSHIAINNLKYDYVIFLIFKTGF